MDASRIAKEASRLLPFAEKVLKKYPFLTREVEHLATHSNVMFRVITESGQQLVLRVGTPHANTRSNIDVEVAWLDALHSEADLDIVAPIRTAGGGLVAEDVDPETGEVRPCVLFTWVPGVPLGEGSGTFGYRLLGQMSASLQKHGKTWRPPVGAVMRRWNRIFYYDKATDPVIIDDPLFGHLFDIPRRATISKASQVAQSVIDESWSYERAQVVHGDLHEWNVHKVGSRLHAFDFEDVMIALPEQDAAVCLFSTRLEEQKDMMWDAYRKGFESVGEWPIADDRQLDGFHAARQIMLMNYAARTLPIGEAMRYLDHVMPWLDGFVRRYG
ncbi:MAG: phosphotransferase [Actinomycetota bacterium]|nr:phosphotransferase [Actinomycetota bacterium]